MAVVDECGVWSRGITSTEVTELYNVFTSARAASCLVLDVGEVDFELVCCIADKSRSHFLSHASEARNSDHFVRHIAIRRGRHRRSKQGEGPSGGQLFAMPPNMQHYVYADEETVLQLNSNGPWGLTYVNEKDDPRKTQ